MNARKFFTKAVEKWPVKVLSLGLAIVLFVFHRMITLETRTFYSNMSIENLGALMPSSSYPRIIKVNIRGEPSGVHSILEEDIEVFIDMDNIDSSGMHIIPVQWRKKGTALGIEPLQISVEPQEIIFSLDNKISKYVPVTADFRGQVEEGYNLNSFSLNPNRIIIDGPAELMLGISQLYTERIDLDGRSGNFTLMASVINNDPLIVIRGNGLTEFSANISQIVSVRFIPNVPIAVTGIMEGLTGELAVRTVGLHLEGENQAAVVDFSPTSNFIRIDCSGISQPGVYVRRIITGTVDRLIFRTEPREVQITITEIEGTGEEE